MRSTTRSLATVVILLATFASGPSIAAEQDDNVEWNGVSHFGFQDRRPLCPVLGEDFEVRLQGYINDVTAIRVQVDDGTTSWIDLAVTDGRGPYDVWTATIPGGVATNVSYFFEITDGTDTDFYSVSGMSESTPGDGGFALDFATLEHAPVGATPRPGGGTVFKVWAPTRTSVHVRGEFNGWSTADPLTDVGEHFVGLVPSATPGDMYKYFFNNSHWNSDARARRLNPTDNYNAFIVDPFDYNWQVVDFDTPDFEQMVIYQLHLGTFAGRNDPLGTPSFPSGYTDVADRVGHLADLGINMVMINPFTEFPGDESAGYNPITQWAPEWIYGTPNDLKYMIDTLHQNGIGVMLDIVWNHFSATDNYLWEYDGTQIYFDDPAVETPWGSQADFDALPVRDYFAHSSQYWLEEFKMDGFRMDGTDYMNLPEQEAAGWGLMQRFNNEIDNRFVSKFAIAEQLPDDPWVTRPTSLGGAGFDAQYWDYFTDRLRDEIFDAAVGDPEMWKVRDMVNGGGSFLNGRYVVNYLELHDEAWPTSGGQRITKTIDTTFPHDDIYAKGRTKLGQGLLMFAPGTPAFLMGTEWLEDTDFGTGSADRIDWSKKTTYAGIFQYYQDIIALRTTRDAFRSDTAHQVYHLNEAGNVLAFQRYDLAGDVYVVIVNFSNNDYLNYRVGLPQPDDWAEIVNSQDLAYEGNGLVNPGTLQAEAIAADGMDQSIELTIPQMGLIVLQWGADTSSIPGDPDGTQTETETQTRAETAVQFGRIHPNPTSERATIEYRLAESGKVRLSVHDVQGRLVATILDGDLPEGDHLAAWDGRDRTGRKAAAGVYNLKLQANGSEATAKVSLIP